MAMITTKWIDLFDYLLRHFLFRLLCMYSLALGQVRWQCIQSPKFEALFLHVFIHYFTQFSNLYSKPVVVNVRWSRQSRFPKGVHIYQKTQIIKSMISTQCNKYWLSYTKSNKKTSTTLGSVIQYFHEKFLIVVLKDDFCKRNLGENCYT